ncbi:MAG: hypothetical protein J0H82_26045 [Alphaproteobacteria bacterium]|jgi:hypothetical protein|nr:hypothetical protein [Alphaproteobacteria bacterium]
MTKPTFDQNPVFRLRPDLMPSDGLFDAADVDLVWNTSQDPETGQVIVCDVTLDFWPTVVRDAKTGGPLYQARREEWTTNWRASYGCSVEGWLTGTDPLATPEGLFGQWLLRDRFASQAEMRRALGEMARIRECGWARAMLAGYQSREPEADESQDEG